MGKKRLIYLAAFSVYGNKKDIPAFVASCCFIFRVEL